MRSPKALTDEVLRLLKILNADRSRLTCCALQSIARRGAAEIAAEIVIENLGFAHEALVGPAAPTLISMAYPRRFPFAQTNRQPDPAPLQSVHEAFPKAVEAAISALFDSSDPYDASRAARALMVLAHHDKTVPGRFARSLVGKFIRDRGLLQAREHRGSDGETLIELKMALALAYKAEPAETEELLKAFLEGASEVGEARIFSIYGEVMRRSHFTDGNDAPEASRLAFKRVVWHAAETNSHIVLREIADIIYGGFRRSETPPPMEVS
jgi:hypothetical protein